MQQLGRYLGLCLLLVLCNVTLAHAVSVTLAWDYTQGTDPAVSFVVYRQNWSIGAFEGHGAIAYPMLTYVDATVLVGNLYCWYVTAQDVSGLESTPSNTVRFQLLQPAQPQNLRGTVGP